MISKTAVVLVLLGVLQLGAVISAKQGKYVICYQGTWSTYRQSLGKFDVTDIDPFLCTHLMYAFFGIEDNGDLRIIDPYLDLEDNGGRGNIKKFNALKLQNPTLKTLAAVGGWNEGSKKFSEMANDTVKRARFVKSVVQFIQRYGFDGIDLDWEYPNQRHNLSYDDRTNYITLLRELKESLDPFGYMLTAAVGSAEFSASISYDIPEVAKYLDIINVMAYDLHGPWDDVVGINAPLYAGKQDVTTRAKQLNVDAIMKYWISQGAPKDKLVVGIPFYGRSFTLASSNDRVPGSAHIGRGIAGQYSVEPGVIGYNEMCEKLQTEQWNVVWEDTQKVPYAYRDRQWVGFETPRSIGLKAKYVLDNDLAGVMIWSIESDDFRGICGKIKYPLLRQINHMFFKSTATGMESSVTATQMVSSASKTSTSSLPSASLSSSLLSPSLPSFLPSDVSSGTTKKTVVGKHGVCRGLNGYMRNPSDCSKFYFCDADATYSFQCPTPLMFDSLTASCNYAELVIC